MNERDRYRRRTHTVQCSLPTHGDELEHEWNGRRFGTPAAKRITGRQLGRCSNTEDRETGMRKYKQAKRLIRVRCSLPVQHEGPCEWMGRQFGTPQKRRASGRRVA